MAYENFLEDMGRDLIHEAMCDPRNVACWPGYTQAVDHYGWGTATAILSEALLLRRDMQAVAAAATLTEAKDTATAALHRSSSYFHWGYDPGWTERAPARQALIAKVLAEIDTDEQLRLRLETRRSSWFSDTGERDTLPLYKRTKTRFRDWFTRAFLANHGIGPEQQGSVADLHATRRKLDDESRWHRAYSEESAWYEQRLLHVCHAIKRALGDAMPADVGEALQHYGHAGDQEMAQHQARVRKFAGELERATAPVPDTILAATTECTDDA